MLCLPTVSAQTTEGKDFWVAFGKIGSSLMQPPYSPDLFNMRIRIICGSKAASVTIYFKNLDKSVHYNMVPYEIYNYDFDNTEKLAVYHEVMSKTDKSVRVTASNPVSVFASTRRTALNDVTNILPVTALGTEYYAISYNALSGNTYDAYAVVATQDNTKIYHNGIEGVTLDAGEVYYKIAPLLADMTGTHITTNHPVAFFAQSQHAIIPNSVGGWGTVLFQQLAPIHTWGKRFFVPVTVIELEYVRIVVSENNTNITQTGGTIRTDAGGQPTLTNLQAGQFVELEISQDHSGCFIKANNPVGVCSFMKSDTIWNGMGAPSQVWIPAIDQSIPSVLMATFEYPIYHYHYALVLTSTATRHNTMVSIGGAPEVSLSDYAWHDHAAMGTSMSYNNFPLTDLTAYYKFSNPAGIIVLGYGVNILGDFPSSYYYLAGSGMRDLDAMFYVNDVHFQDLKENPFCAGEVAFRAEIEGELHADPEHLKWYINDVEEVAARDLLVWNKTFSHGEYEIKMWVRFENDETVSKKDTLTIISCGQNAEFFANDVHYENLPNTTLCNKTGEVNFRAEIEGEYTEIKWYIDGMEYEPARDLLEWDKIFETGTYNIEMWVHFANGEETTIPSTLKMEVFWVKIRNVRQ